jgi:LDH2 family malate/lactate/ureidoglycolate dehydrogenase
MVGRSVAGAKSSPDWCWKTSGWKLNVTGARAGAQRQGNLEMKRDDPDYLERIYHKVWSACGASPRHAQIMAEAISAGDRSGKLGHGMAVFEIPFLMWEQGILDIDAEPETVADSEGVLVVDGRRSSGQLTCHVTMNQVIEKAHNHTIAAAWIRNTNDIGKLSHYVRMALEHDMVGIGACNTPPFAAPYGGMQAITSSAPFCVVCPAGREKPIIFDTAVCEVYDYDLIRAAAEGRRLMTQSLIDPKTGTVTDEPEAYVERPITGISSVLAPIVFHSHKLYGFNIFAEILTGILTPGGRTSPELQSALQEYNGDSANTSIGGIFLMAINVAELMPMDEFKTRVDGYVRSIKNSKLAPGVDEIFLPGERSLAKVEWARTEGVEFLEEAWEKLCENTQKVGVDVEELRG